MKNLFTKKTMGERISKQMKKDMPQMVAYWTREAGSTMINGTLMGAGRMTQNKLNARKTSEQMLQQAAFIEQMNQSGSK